MRAATSRCGCAARRTSTSPRAAGRANRSTTSSRTMASRSPTSSATRRATTRPTARTTSTATATTTARTSASKARATTRPSRRRAGACSARCWRRCCCRRARRCSPRATSSATRRAATTTRTARTTRRAGSTGRARTTISIALCARLLALRRQAGVFATHWHDGLPDRLGLPDLTWLRADGAAMLAEDWVQPDRQVLGCLVGKPGRLKVPLLLLFNAEPIDRAFPLPGGTWQVVLHTVDDREHEPLAAGRRRAVRARGPQRGRARGGRPRTRSRPLTLTRIPRCDSPVPAACCCTRRPCPARTARATSAPTRATSSTGSSPAGRPCGRSCRSAASAPATRPT